MEKEIFKVIKILDSETIVLNAGKNNRINIGDKFEIYGPGQEVIDEDWINYGTLDIIKEKVTVDNLYDKMCLCRHHEKSAFASMVGLSSLYVSSGYKSLNVDKTQMSNEMDEDHTIRIGDKAKRIYINTEDESTND